MEYLIFVLCVLCSWSAAEYVGHHEVYGHHHCPEEIQHITRLGDEVCMKQLGCFKLTNDYYHPQYRPCNALPEPRLFIHTQFVLFTRGNQHVGMFLKPRNETNIKESGFVGNKSTQFIVHGYEEGPLQDAWILIMVEKLLRHNDSNVVVVDWSKGSAAPYIQAAANARIVGAEIARLVNALKLHTNFTTSLLHIIGHGLGAHVAGYAGQSILPTIGRITGLDPAYKYFCNMPEVVRLDSKDALFVDVIHTESNVHDVGLGGCHKMGHVDFYPNGRGCSRLAGHAHENYYHGSGCIENGAVQLFLTTFRNDTMCQLIGQWCRSYKAFQRGECGNCTAGSRCSKLGLQADEYLPFKNSNTSSMYLFTKTYPPFCLYEYRLLMKVNVDDDDYSPNGNIYAVLRGDKKPLFLQLSFFRAHKGSEYTFLVTTAFDIGEVKNVTLKWQEVTNYEEIYYDQNSDTKIERVNVTLLNSVNPVNMMPNTVDRMFCVNEAAGRENGPGWMTYLSC